MRYIKDGYGYKAIFDEKQDIQLELGKMEKILFGKLLVQSCWMYL